MNKQAFILWKAASGYGEKQRKDLEKEKPFPTSPSPAKSLLIGGSVTWWLLYRGLSVGKNTKTDLSLAFK